MDGLLRGDQAFSVKNKKNNGADRCPHAHAMAGGTPAKRRGRPPAAVGTTSPSPTKTADAMDRGVREGGPADPATPAPRGPPARRAGLKPQTPFAPSPPQNRTGPFRDPASTRTLGFAMTVFNHSRIGGPGIPPGL